MSAPGRRSRDKTRRRWFRGAPGPVRKEVQTRIRQLVYRWSRYPPYMLQWFVLQRAAIELLWAIGDVNSVDEGYKTLKPMLKKMYGRNREERERIWGPDSQAVVFDDAIVFGRLRTAEDVLIAWGRSWRLRKVLE